MSSAGTRLYELAGGLREAIDAFVDPETGEVSDPGALGAVTADFDEKLEGCAVVVKEARADAEAIGAEIERLKARKRACEGRAERLREYVARCMLSAGRTSVATPRARVSMRRSRSVEVDPDADLPDEYMSRRVDERPDKKKISEAIAAGLDVPGARFVEKWSVVLG